MGEPHGEAPWWTCVQTSVSPISCFPAVGPWVCHLASLSLMWLTCAMGITIPPSKGVLRIPDILYIKHLVLSLAYSQCSVGAGVQLGGSREASRSRWGHQLGLEGWEGISWWKRRGKAQYLWRETQELGCLLMAVPSAFPLGAEGEGETPPLPASHQSPCLVLLSLYFAPPSY